MVFRKLQNAVPDAAAEGTEVAGVGLQGHLGQLIDDAVKALFEEGQRLSFSPAILKCRDHVEFRFLVQNFHHVTDDFRTLLEVGVNEADIVSCRVLQARVNSGLLAEIPGEGYHLHGAFLGGVELFQIVQRCVPAAVVNEDDLVIIAAAVKGGDDRLLKQGDVIRFVITGNYQG